MIHKSGKGLNRRNLAYMRKFYLTFPECETVSHKLTQMKSSLFQRIRTQMIVLEQLIANR